MRKKCFLYGIICILTLSFLCACSDTHESADDVLLESQEAGNVSFAYNVFSGVVRASGEMKIEKKNDYEIEEIKVSAGDDVNKGDVLFVYDVEKASLTLEKTALEIEQLGNKITMLNENKGQLEKEKNSASASQQLSYSLEIKQIETEILEANYNIQTKQKEMGSLQETINNAQVMSEIKGTVMSINSNGESDNYGNPKPFMVIAETGKLDVMGYVNETNISDILEGMPVIISSRTDDRTWNGTISKIDTENPVADQNYYSDSMGASSRYPFYISLESTDGLLNGQHVYIKTAEDY